MELTTKVPGQDMVVINNGRPVTTSLKVADVFGKQHKNVLRDIESLDCSAEFRRLNFEPSLYQNTQGKMQPMQFLTKDGCTFLIMGFTGAAAAAWKERFIAAFNKMESALSKPMIPSDIERELKAIRQESKETRQMVAGIAGLNPGNTPEGHFLKTRCEVGKGLRIEKQKLYGMYAEYCDRVHRVPAKGYSDFFKWLYSRTIARSGQVTSGGKRIAVVKGIGLKRHYAN